MIKINGKDFDVSGKTLAEYIDSTNYDAKRIAVEINDVIIPKADYNNVILKDGDIVEVVSFVGGG